MPIAVALPVPCGLVQHVFSPPARMKLSRLTAPPWPRRRAKNALHVCGVLGYVALARRVFLWSPKAGFLRHIF